MTSLVTRPEGLLFGELKRLCALTDGNLSRHLDVLHEEGWVDLGDRLRETLCGIATAGRNGWPASLPGPRRRDRGRDPRGDAEGRKGERNGAGMASRLKKGRRKGGGGKEERPRDEWGGGGEASEDKEKKSARGPTPIQLASYPPLTPHALRPEAFSGARARCLRPPGAALAAGRRRPRARSLPVGAASRSAARICASRVSRWATYSAISFSGDSIAGPCPGHKRRGSRSRIRASDRR